jgi:hypothetical protein
MSFNVCYVCKSSIVLDDNIIKCQFPKCRIKICKECFLNNNKFYQKAIELNFEKKTVDESHPNIICLKCKEFTCFTHQCIGICIFCHQKDRLKFPYERRGKTISIPWHYIETHSFHKIERVHELLDIIDYMTDIKYKMQDLKKPKVSMKKEIKPRKKSNSINRISKNIKNLKKNKSY